MLRVLLKVYAMKQFVVTTFIYATQITTDINTHSQGAVEKSIEPSIVLIHSFELY